MLRVAITAAVVTAALVWVNPAPAEACGVKVNVKSSKIQRERVARARATTRTPIAAGPVDTRQRSARNRGGTSAERAATGAGGGDVGTAPDRDATRAARNTPRKSRVRTKAPAREKPTRVADAQREQPTTPDSSAIPDPDEGDETADTEPTTMEDATDTVTGGGAGEPKKPAGRFTPRVFFANGSAAIPAGSKAKLDRNIRWLEQNPDKTITIEGHTNTRGSLDANMALSEKRAQAVKDYLVEGGVDESRITVTAYGPERPEFSPGSSGKNRRVVIVVNE